MPARHAARGMSATIRLKPNSTSGQVSSTIAPTSNAAAALPVHLAAAPPITGPSIIAAY